MNTKSDFSLLQCRESLASFKQHEVEQAVVVATSNNPRLISKAAHDRDMGRVVFWVNEWMAAEGIQSKKEALARLRVVPAIRRERQTSARRLLTRINLSLGFALYLGQTAFWFAA